jgi:opacity protein-like surface antigen
MKWALLLSVLWLCAAGTPGQEAPKMELFGGYSYVHMVDLGTANINGGSGSLSFNFKPWLGAVADVGGYDGGDNGLDGALVTYLFGPKIAIRRGRITPFFQVLLGGAYTSADPPPAVGLLARRRAEGGVAGGGEFGSSNSFAMAAGGGIDLRASRHIAIRLVQAEYLLTKFQDGISNQQNSTRISAGLVFGF